MQSTTRTAHAVDIFSQPQNENVGQRPLHIVQTKRHVTPVSGCLDANTDRDSCWISIIRIPEAFTSHSHVNDLITLYN